MNTKNCFYTKPSIEFIRIQADELLQIAGASRFDNDGDGTTDQYPVIPSDPEDGIGAKKGYFEYQPWTPWEDME